MITSIDKAQGEGNCVGATRGGKEACGCSIGVATGSIHATTARLRTETFYKAGGVGRVSQTSQSRSQLILLVKNELVQRKITFLSGEICTDGVTVHGLWRRNFCLLDRRCQVGCRWNEHGNQIYEDSEGY